MKWWFVQSLTALLAAFALGVPIGYLIWRLQFRRIKMLDVVLGSAGGPNTVSNVVSVGSGSGAVLNAPSEISATSKLASGAMLDRLRVEHAAELARTRSTLEERETAILELGKQLEASRKSIADRDSRIQTLASQGSVGASDTPNVDRDSKLKTLAEQRDAARAGLAKALADYESRLSALRTEHEHELKSLRAEHAAASERLQNDAESRVNEIRSERESVATALQKANGEFDEQRSVLQSRHEAALADLRRRAERAEAELSTARTELDGQRAEVAKRSAAFDAERDALQAEMTSMKTSLTDAQTALDRAKDDIAGAVARRDALQKDAATASEFLEKAQSDLAKGRSELQIAKTALEATRSVSDKNRLEAEDAKAELASLQAELSSIRERHRSLEARYDDLAQRERAARESLGSQRLVGNGVGDSDDGDAGDDLQRIEGIGPRISASLQAVGIRRFSQLAAATDDRLRDALVRAGLNLAPSLPTWSEQAKFLAAGDEASFRELVDRLIAGREAR